MRKQLQEIKKQHIYISGVFRVNIWLYKWNGTEITISKAVEAFPGFFLLWSSFDFLVSLLGCYFCVERYIITEFSKDHRVFIFRIGLRTLKNQAMRFFERSLTVYQSTWMNILEYAPLHKYRWENLQYCCVKICCCHSHFYWLCSFWKVFRNSYEVEGWVYIYRGTKFYIKDKVVGYIARQGFWIRPAFFFFKFPL